MQIFVVRHGESLGNLDPSAYAKYGDCEIPATLWGIEQGSGSGKAIARLCDERPELHGCKFKVIHSPYQRTVETKDAVIAAIGEDRIARVRADTRLREQDMGAARPFIYDIPFDAEAMEPYREAFEAYALAVEKDKFTARPPLGESGEDVAARTKDALDALKKETETDHTPIIIVGHKVSNSTLEKHLLNKDADWYAQAPRRNNCDVLLFEGDFDKGFTVSAIHEGKKRTPSLPPKYKARQAHGGSKLI
jgi:2,3-bisphosphoglycerate-dependent phosphoglycerate mutase